MNFLKKFNNINPLFFLLKIMLSMFPNNIIFFYYYLCFQTLSKSSSILIVKLMTKKNYILWVIQSILESLDFLIKN